MLVLSRKPNESVVVGGLDRPEPMLKVTVLEIGSSRVILGFEADKGIPVHRCEVWERISTDAPAGLGSAQRLARRLTVVRQPRARRGTGAEL
ncbi:MAG TPA: carbon storage regulator [Phycisphaerae bacterium]|nr:carbon storage regulator [Phycisphaerae bacterium]